MVKLVNSTDTTGITLPKDDFIAIPAIGKALEHINGYSMSFSGEPFLYATVKKVFNYLSETGILDRLDQFCFISADESGSLKNWVLIGPTPENNSMPFTPEEGFLSGSPGWIDTGFDALSANNYSLDNAHVSVYLSAIGAEGSNPELGSLAGPARTIMYPYLAGGDFGGRINSGTTLTFPFGNSGNPGHYLIQRSSSTLTRFVYNGELVGSDSDSPTTELPSGNFTVGRSTSVYGVSTIAGWSIGAAMSVSQDQERKLAEAFALLAAAFLAD